MEASIRVDPEKVLRGLIKLNKISEPHADEELATAWIWIAARAVQDLAGKLPPGALDRFKGSKS